MLSLNKKELPVIQKKKGFSLVNCLNLAMLMYGDTLTQVKWRILIGVFSSEEGSMVEVADPTILLSVRRCYGIILE